VRVWNGTLEWLLLTTRPVETLDQALDIIAWYSRRWTVEEFHKVWKTGCRAEQRRLEEADRLVPLLGALAVVAVRLLRRCFQNLAARLAAMNVQAVVSRA
jgi:IS4 transposase